MGIQTQDTFVTGSRGSSGVPTVGQAIAAWNPSSGGDTWTAQAATSTFSYNSSTSQGQITGSNAANLATLNGEVSGSQKSWYDSLATANFQRTSSSDTTGIILRFTNANNYYRAVLGPNGLVISKVVNGTATQLAGPFAFSDSGSKFTIKFLAQGFGLNGSVNNLAAKVWLVGQGEPSSYQVTASDGSLASVGLVGVYLKGNSNSTTQSVDSFLSQDPSQFTPAPAYNAVEDLPYGMTNYVNPTNPPVLAQQMISDLATWGSGTWLRHQLQEQSIETAPGLFNWALLDDAVYRCNVAGIKVWLCLQGFASWRLSIDGYGNNCKLAAPVTTAYAYTAIPVTALPAGANVPHLGQITIDYGGANPETVYIWNPGATYTAGVALLSISTSKTAQVAWTPAFNHVGSAQIYQQNGPMLPSAADMAYVAGQVAARYNGQAGYGKIDVLQIENENYDILPRIGVQSAAWDNGGAILAPVYVAAYNAIKAVYPTCVVCACAVRKTAATSLQHQINWLIGFFAGVKALGGSVDAIDKHDYRDGNTDWNGNPVPDPRQNTYTDGTGAVINNPNVSLELWTMKNVAAQYGYSPQINIGEFGCLLYDDGTGFNATTNATYSSGTPTTSIGVTSLAKTIADATPIWMDTGGANPELFYAWGQTAVSGSATTIQITTNPAGSLQAQVAWTPAHTHNSGVTIYAETSGNTQTQANDLIFTQAMYDAGRANQISHMFRYDLNNTAVVAATTVPQNSNWPRSWTQSINNVYTYLPGYYLTLLYAQLAETRYWQGLPTGKNITMTAYGSALSLSSPYSGAITMSEQVP